MIVYLIGFRCTGKTTSGKILSSRLGFNFFDTDLYIKETEKREVSEIVKDHGWDYFRDLETKALKKASNSPDTIVSTGGGIIEREINKEIISDSGKSIWLKADRSVIAQRLKNDESTKDLRPSLTKLDPVDEIFQVLSRREPIYKSVSSFIVDTSDINPAEVAEQIYQYLIKGE